MIIKEPSTSFSLRVEKVMDIAGFFRVARRFITFGMDRRPAVRAEHVRLAGRWLGGKLLYVCKYTIPSVTFKIQASVNGNMVYAASNMPEEKVPPHVIQLGIDAAEAIGNGLYGVDIKNNNGDACVIEVNDNPSLESGEDAHYPGLRTHRQSLFAALIFD